MESSPNAPPQKETVRHAAAQHVRAQLLRAWGLPCITSTVRKNYR